MQKLFNFCDCDISKSILEHRKVRAVFDTAILGSNPNLANIYVEFASYKKSKNILFPFYKNKDLGCYLKFCKGNEDKIIMFVGGCVKIFNKWWDRRHWCCHYIDYFTN